MPDSFPILLALVIALAIGLGVVNGFHDAANAIATSIGTRVLTPASAIIMAAVLNFAGAMSGTAVAQTIGKGIVSLDAFNQQELGMIVIISALAAVILWNMVTWYFGLPSSSSHALIAGLLGAGVAMAGSGSIVWGVLRKVLSAVAIAPALGFIGGFSAMVLLMWLFRRSTPLAVEGSFAKLQILSAAFVAYSHGKNDGQMPIGLITLALVINSGQTSLWDNIPL